MTNNGNEPHLLHAVVNDLWQFLKKYSGIKDSDEYWSEMLDDANAISKKHDSHPLCNEFLIASMEYFSETANGNELKLGWRTEKND